MIQIQDLTKSYGTQTLFENISFQINRFEKVGLVGRNGYGKTTLFRLITGEEEFDTGKITIPKNYSIGYVKQNLDFTEDTILKEGINGLPFNQKSDSWRVEKILFGLGFNKEDLLKHPSQISGGFQVRLNLAKTLLSNSNFLLLDEPTNYLDITSIRWLIQFLKSWQGEIFLITHDRGFMDEIVTHTILIHRKKIKKIEGNTEKLYLQIAREEEIYEKQRINEEKKRKADEIYINRFRAKARLAGLIQSRIKMLAKSEKKEKLEKIKDLDFRFKYTPIEANILIEINKLKFGYENTKILINDLSFIIRKKDRIAIIGPNGKGKTTLLRLIYQELIPDTGEIKKHNLLKTGYFGQTNRSTLHPENTVMEEIMLTNSQCTEQEARNISGGLLFEEDNALKKIKILSGGEKSRVLLGKILASQINLLLLDEPTNHLDMESCDALLAAIDDFDGAVVIVTHNEMFLHAIAERLIIFDNNQINTFEGTYNEFLEKIGWQTELSVNISNDKNISANKFNIKEIKRKKAQLIEEKSKKLKPIEKKYNDLENYIIKLEKQFNELQEKLIEASKQKQGEKIGIISKNIHDIEKEIKESYEELEVIMIEHEKESKKYTELLNSIQ